MAALSLPDGRDYREAEEGLRGGASETRAWPSRGGLYLRDRREDVVTKGIEFVLRELSLRDLEEDGLLPANVVAETDRELL